MALFQLLRKPAQEKVRRVLCAVETLIMNEQVKKDIERDVELDYEYDHVRDAVKYAKTLAAKRKIDPNIAGAAAAVQNVGRIVTGKTDDHALAGYSEAKKLLSELHCFSNQEIEQIATAVRNHSRKAEIDAPLDELCKDVDVYSRYLHGYVFTNQTDLARLNRMRVELEF